MSSATILRHLRSLSVAEHIDRELLRAFALERDESAFALLVRRHGPLALGVCRRLLRHEQDAEDELQATFLVLARNTASLPGEMIGGWLHGVAWNMAQRVRRAAAQQHARETQAGVRQMHGPVAEASLRELQALLDAEVAWLPEKLRSLFMLCCLEGRSKAEAARELGWKEGTVSSRLAQARERLRARLVRRGVSLTAALTALAVTQDATAALPVALARTTVRAALATTPTASSITTKLLIASLLSFSLAVAGVGLAISSKPAELADAPAETAGTVLRAAVARDAVDNAAAEDSSLKGSGKLVTKELDLAGFTSVDVRHGFRVDITQGKAFGVAVTADDNLFEYIKAGKDGSVLKVSLDARNKSFRNATFKAAITMPTLEKVSLSDVCNGTIKGFTAAKDFKAHVADLSTLGGELKSTTLELEALDASTLTLKGSAKEGKLTAHDASHLLLADFALDRANVHLSEVSTATVRVRAKLDYNLSEASGLTYHGDPSLGKKVISEGSSVTRGNRESAELGDGAPWKTLIADLEKQIPKLMEEAKVPGLSIAIIKDAKLFWRRGFGVKDVTSKVLVDNDTVFEAASTSKPVFAYAVMKLCEKGVMDLDTPLTKYTPERFLKGDPRLDLITARHVLSHTSGFQNFRSREKPLKIHFTPGKEWAYSGEGYCYLQSVVTHLTGKVNPKDCAKFEDDLEVCATDFDEYMKANVLTPFGMASSGYLWNDTIEKRMAPGHDEKGKPTKLNRKPTGPSVARYGAVGQLCTTPTDYAKFLIEIIDPKPSDAFRLKKKSLKEMLRPQIKRNAESSWALGWEINHTEKGDFIRHGGGNPGYACFVAASVERKSGYVIMTNCENTGYFGVIAKLIAGDILSRFLGGELREAPE
jgi:RNA polymerase sigma factor (sigma-70 family)